MTFCDTELEVHSDEQGVPQSVIDTLRATVESHYVKLSPTDFYHLHDNGDITAVNTSNSDHFECVIIPEFERERFHIHGVSCTDKYIIRDEGGLRCRVYLEDHSFTIPLQVMRTEVWSLVE